MTGRLGPVLLAAALTIPLIPAIAPAAADSSVLVDAGASASVDLGAPVGLTATVEGTAGPLTIAWTTSAACTIAAPDELTTTATCTEPGLHEFSVEVTAPEGTASDTVRHVHVRRGTLTFIQAQGTTTVGLPDEHAYYHAGYGSDDGELDNATVRVPFEVPAGVTSMQVRLSWTAGRNNYDLDLLRPDGTLAGRAAWAGQGTLEIINTGAPATGTWTAVVRPVVAVAETWTLTATGPILQGDIPLPTVDVRDLIASAGDTVTFAAQVAGGTGPFAITWEDDAGSIAFDDGTGDAHTLVADGPRVVAAKVTDANGLEAIDGARLTLSSVEPQPLTVVAVIDSAYNPYHYDFLGHQHPWNRDADPANDLDFSLDPAAYIPGHPGGTAIQLTIPGSPTDPADMPAADGSEWARWQSSNLNTGVKLHWFPGTKIVGALSFGTTGFRSSNSEHGTRSAASAAGNWHGSCPECLFVLITGDSNQGLRWVSQQPWIDVVTNSYGHSLTGGLVRDNVYFGHAVAATQAGVEQGLTLVFSAGNGLLNAFDVPMLTYWSSEKGPDWVVTVGAVAPNSKQTYSGAGKPVDISSIGSSYPSTGGTTANGTGTHSGTSNAAPVTAGYFAQVIQESREILGDVTPGHAGGVVATGTPVACGAAYPACPLGDGVLTRNELTDLVFHNVLPSPTTVSIDTVWPSTPLAYYYQGHGYLAGKLGAGTTYPVELGRMVGAARGDSAPLTRPAGEANWMVVDSYCRQKLWGAWTGGYYDGTAPTLDPAADPIAVPFWTWCSGVPQDALRDRTPQP